MTHEGMRTYPETRVVAGQDLTLRYMAAADKAGILTFARAIPEHDLLFLRRDITEDAAIDDWLADIAGGFVTTLLAEADGRIVGYATIHKNKLRWEAHVAELRIMIAESMRGKGLGRILTQEAFAIALTQGIEKMVAQMTLDQKGAIATFEGIGFRPEALLRDHVKDRQGAKHDLLVLSHEVGQFEAQHNAYGISEAFGN
ncbi:MAG: GNAT family N-acetyltransferase [Tepidiformaceae bacterium]